MSEKNQVINVWLVELKPGAEKELGTIGPAIWQTISELPGFINYRWLRSLDNPMLVASISEWETMGDLERFQKFFHDLYGNRIHEVFNKIESFNLIEVKQSEYKHTEGGPADEYRHHNS